MFLDSGEIEEGGAVALFVEEADVDLEPVVEVEAHFVLTLGERLVDPRKGENVHGNRFDCVRAVLPREGEKQVEVANGFLATPQRSCWGNGGDALWDTR